MKSHSFGKRSRIVARNEKDVDVAGRVAVTCALDEMNSASLLLLIGWNTNATYCPY